MWCRWGGDHHCIGGYAGGNQAEGVKVVTTRSGIHVGMAGGRGVGRPLVAYLGVAIVGTWVLLAVEDVRQGGDLLGAAVAAASALLGPGWLLAASFALLLGLPAMVLTTELVHRLRPVSVVARSVVGAVAWAGWGVFVAALLAALSHIVLVAEALAVDLAVVALAGAAFSIIGFDERDRRSGGGLILFALIDAACIVGACAWMAGRWGGPV